ncbi:MAG: hypothetical protein ACLT3R_00675 [Roseburia sp.]
MRKFGKTYVDVGRRSGGCGTYDDRAEGSIGKAAMTEAVPEGETTTEERKKRMRSSMWETGRAGI